MKIKICGIKYRFNLSQLTALAPDYFGFIFYPKSPRFIVDSLKTKDLHSIPPEIQKVGVFVNATLSEVEQRIKQFGLEVVQLHGDENPEFCAQVKNLGVEVWKAFGVSLGLEFQELMEYEDAVDAYVFDTQTKTFGGSGVTFDWDLLNNYLGKRPFLLSGGLGLENAGDFLKVSHPKLMGYDLNSRLEDAPGLKNIQKVSEIINTIHDNT